MHVMLVFLECYLSVHIRYTFWFVPVIYSKLKSGGGGTWCGDHGRPWSSTPKHWRFQHGCHSNSWCDSNTPLRRMQSSVRFRNNVDTLNVNLPPFLPLFLTHLAPRSSRYDEMLSGMVLSVSWQVLRSYAAYSWGRILEFRRTLQPLPSPWKPRISYHM